jgi:nucleoside-diphosphate-sugar epimerase
MRILVTGSTGYLGSNLVPLLAAKNQILEITRNLEKSHKLFGSNTRKYLLNNDQNSLVEEVREFNPQIVIHLAAKLGSSDEYNEAINYLDANIYFLTRILDAIKGCNIKLFINTGTFAEKFSQDGFSYPAYFYAATKTASRSLVDYYSQLCSFKQITVVPFSIYGKKDSNKKIIDIIIDSLDSNDPVPLTPGNQILDFIHIDDVLRGYMKIIENLDLLPNKSNIELGTGKGHSLKELASIIEAISNKKTNIIWGAKSYRPLDPMVSIANMNYINELIEWSAQIPLSEGIKLYLKRHIK